MPAQNPRFSEFRIKRTGKPALAPNSRSTSFTEPSPEPHTKAKLGTDDKALYRKAVAEYKLYLKFSPQGELAGKAKQNIQALEARLRQ